MKVEDIKSAQDAQNFCEGIVNDLVECLITRDEAMLLLGQYTVRILEIQKIKENKSKTNMWGGPIDSGIDYTNLGPRDY